MKPTNTLLKSDVTRRDHVVRCGSHECWFTLCQFHCQFHSRRHGLRITLKLVTREPRNRDNVASDVWALTAYSNLSWDPKIDQPVSSSLVGIWGTWVDCHGISAGHAVIWAIGHILPMNIQSRNSKARILDGWLSSINWLFKSVDYNKRIMLLRAVIIGRQLLYALDHAVISNAYCSQQI